MTDATGPAKKSPATKTKTAQSSFTITAAVGVLAKPASLATKAIDKPSKELDKTPKAQSDPATNINDDFLEGDQKTLIGIANKLFKEAKAQMEQQGNIKTSIKETVTGNLHRMLQIVQKMEERHNTSLIKMEKKHAEELLSLAGSAGGTVIVDEALEKVSKEIKNLTEAVQQLKTPSNPPEAPPEMKELIAAVKKQGENVSETQRQIEVIRVQMNEHQKSTLTYAEATAIPRTSSKTEKQTIHSIIVSSEDSKDTSNDVIERIRTTVNARESGIRVERLRKAKGQRVILGCHSREELEKISGKITGAKAGLKVENAQNKNPLIILRDVMKYNTDENIITSIKNQNKHLLGNLAPEEITAEVRYRMKARNPLQNHVIVRVSPKVWTRLTEEGYAHIDLQNVEVKDQSPLVQCSRCLGYGHGRRLCTEAIDVCSHCAGPHLKNNCPQWLAGDVPACRNCQLAKLEKTDHNAFDSKCPIRKKWDELAKSSVQYC